MPREPTPATSVDINRLAAEIESNHREAKRLYTEAGKLPIDNQRRLDSLVGRNDEGGLVREVRAAANEQHETRLLVEKQGKVLATIRDRDQRSDKKATVSSLAGSAGGGATVIAIVELLKLAGVI